jgi:hypothetical protein
MTNKAIKIQVSPREKTEVKQAADEIYQVLAASGLRFSITACALLGQLLGRCGCISAGEWPEPDWD